MYISYYAPVVTSVDPLNGPAFGGDSITIRWEVEMMEPPLMIMMSRGRYFGADSVNTAVYFGTWKSPNVTHMRDGSEHCCDDQSGCNGDGEVRCYG